MNHHHEPDPKISKLPPYFYHFVRNPMNHHHQPDPKIPQLPPYFYPPHPVGAHITIVTTDEARDAQSPIQVEVRIAKNIPFLADQMASHNIIQSTQSCIL